MSRHRNVRSMNYQDEYDGYDDVYGHSVEDDYCVSPGTASQFLYDRNNVHPLASYMGSEEIVEEEEPIDDQDPLQDSSSFSMPNLSDIEQAQLNSCLEELRNIVGETTADHILVPACLEAQFDVEKAANIILNRQADGPKPQRQPRERKYRDPSMELNKQDDPILDNFKSQETFKTNIYNNEPSLETSTSDLSKNVLSPLSDITHIENVTISDEQSLSDNRFTQDNLKVMQSEKTLKNCYAVTAQVNKLPVNSIRGSQKTNTSLAISDLATQHETEECSNISNSELPQLKDLYKFGNPRLSLAEKVANSSLSGIAQPSSSGESSVSGTSILTNQKDQERSNSVMSELEHFIGSPKFSSSGISLASLAAKHNLKDHTTETIDCVRAQKDVVVQLCRSPFSASGSPKSVESPKYGSPRFSLAALAASHQQQTGVGDLLPTNNTSPKIVEARPSTVLKPFEKKCENNHGSDIKSSNITESHFFNKHLLSNQKAEKKLPVFSLAALAEKHAAVSEQHISELKCPEKSDSSNIYGGAAVRPPPGFKTLSRSSEVKPGLESGTPVSDLSPSVRDIKKSSPPKPPPGFSKLPSVCLSSLAAQHSAFTKSPRVATTSTSKLFSSNKQTVKNVSSSPMLSSFGRAISFNPKKKITPEQQLDIHYEQRIILYPKFSYQVQISKFPQAKKQKDLQIVAFDFSIPSPDDIIKERQKGAFTRTGERGKRTSEQSDGEPPTQTSENSNITDVPSTEDSVGVTNVTDIPATVSGIARMTFSSGKQTVSGFTPEKNETGSGEPNGSTTSTNPADVQKVKRNLKMEDNSDLVSALASPLKSSKSDPEKPLSRNVSSSDLGAMGKSKLKLDKEALHQEFDRRIEGGKEHINLVVIGHVDAGKSTLMGHVLYQLGFVNKRTMHKYEQESKKLGKASFAYAWVLDETEEERSRGVTMDVAQTRFETDHKIVTLLDAPGHKDFIPNMITGAAQADVAVLVVNSTRGEFETGFESGGQTREHAMLIRSLGVSQLVIAVNKMDTVEWGKTRFDEISHKLKQFLKQTGFKESDVTFIPCSGLIGENLTKSSSVDALTSWYSGPTLVQQIDKLEPPERAIDAPFRMCVTDVFKGIGAGYSVSGTLQAGSVQAGERVLCMPHGDIATVKSITIDDVSMQCAFAGDNVVLTLTGIDLTNISVGSILCDPSSPITSSARLKARVVIFNIDLPITKGFPVVFHYQSMSEAGHIRKLITQLNRSTGQVMRNKPRCLTKNTSAIIQLELDRPVCIELYKDFKDLGRFMMRYAGATIAAGVVTGIIDKKA